LFTSNCNVESCVWIMLALASSWRWVSMRAAISLVGSTSRIVYRPLPQDDPKQRQPDITRAQTLLSWQPQVELEEGLAKTVGYFKSKLAAEAR